MSPRLEGLLLPSIADVSVLSLDVSHEAIRLDLCSTAAGAACPDCGSESSRVHSSYLRFPADVPSGGRLVLLRLRVRRFFCPDSSCARRTFAEQLPGLTRRHSRWTERLRSTLAAVGLALAGRAGARTARVFGVPISRSPVLRLLDALPEPDVPAPRVVGVDEYATRKGRVYGTVLVDVETRRPVDLLPDREASSLAAWLAKRPGIEIVCRDRALFFAEGAPQPGHPRRRRSPTAGICGTTSGRPPSGLSPATASAFASWSPIARGRPMNRRRPRRRWTLHGGASGSPTASESGTPRSTRCWKPATAAVPSGVSSR
ncbi:ISL3 family transposase [Streptomyces sp. NPDC058052]|uniref:ISL3 family transposase n=1 Tax=Streptomyces sp. NPDC058052 TaxID=3346316 RepID=UPI0036F140FD